MRQEAVAASEIGIPWDTRLWATPLRDASPASAGSETKRSSRLLSAREWLKVRRAFFQELTDASAEYDLVLLRYSPHDPLLLSFLRGSGCHVGLVHHTVTASEYRSLPGAVNHLRGALEVVAQPLLVNECDVSVAVTPEIARSLKSIPRRTPPPTVVMPNSIITGGTAIPDERREHPEMLFLASEFFPWQGLDLLLGGLHAVTAPFTLHVVGKVPQRERALAEEDARVVFHGTLSPEQIADLAAACWVGISTMAQQRTGMLEACPIKVREYLNLGLPVVGAHEDVFPDHFPFFIRVEPTLSEVIAACHMERFASREQVAAAAYPFIDKRQILSETYENLRTILNGGRVR